MHSTKQRLFTPGSGATPPALTGREPGQTVLNRCLAEHRPGYVRCPPARLPPPVTWVIWSAGIPSPMTHVLDHVRPSAPERTYP